MVYRHVPALRARFLQTSAMVLLAAAPQALAQTPVCDDTVLPIPAGCERATAGNVLAIPCLLYTSPSPRDRQKSRMPSSA